MCQLISEGLVSVPAPCSEAIDWPVNRPRHFHLLGHLSKTHHQLPQNTLQHHYTSLRHIGVKLKDKHMYRPHHSFLVVISLWVNTHNHPHFSFSIKVVFKEMCNFGVSVRHHLDDKSEDKKTVELLYNIFWDTDLTGSTHLVFTQDFNTGPQCHQGLVDITCTKCD